jgi:hypothetical protein
MRNFACDIVTMDLRHSLKITMSHLQTLINTTFLHSLRHSRHSFSNNGYEKYLIEIWLKMN